MELPILLGNYDRQTDRPTNQQPDRRTDRVIGPTSNKYEGMKSQSGPIDLASNMIHIHTYISPHTFACILLLTYDIYI